MKLTERQRSVLRALPVTTGGESLVRSTSFIAEGSSAPCPSSISGYAPLETNEAYSALVQCEKKGLVRRASTGYWQLTTDGIQAR